MIVVDVNVIAYLWIPGDMTELAERALDQDSDWLSVALWKSEFRNILAGYLRRKELTKSQVMECIRAAESQLDGREYAVPSQLVVDMVARSRCSAYDCEYVALAKDLGVKLVTLDKQILREFPRISVSLEAFVK